MCQEIQVLLAHSLCAKKFNFSCHINYVLENNFFGFVTHILCAIKIYWHLFMCQEIIFLTLGLLMYALLSVIRGVNAITVSG
jgi:hypothetical protein